MTRPGRSRWRTTLAVLQLVAGGGLGLMLLLFVPVVLVEVEGLLEGVQMVGAVLAFGTMALGWGLSAFWPDTGHWAKVAGVALWMPVIYLFVLDWIGFAEPVSLALGAVTIALILGGGVLAWRRPDDDGPPVVTDRLVISPDRAAVTAFIGLVLMMVVLSLGVAMRAPVVLAAIGWFGVAFFGIAGLWIARGILAPSLVVADAAGLLDRSRLVGWGRIDWDEIAGFEAASRGVVVHPHDPEGFLSRTRRRRILHAIDLGHEGVLLNTMLARTSELRTAELLEAARRHQVG